MMNTAPIPEIRRWRAFAVLAVSFFMTIVDLTIVNVALPTIGRELHISESDLQWVVTAYGITFGGFLLLGGRAADLLGRRRVLMLGLTVFTAASLGAGLATSSGLLIAMRGLQGLGAAVVLPAALSIVMNMFAEGADRNKALGLWGGIGAAGATIGLIAGGLLTRYAGWEYIFFLNVPIGVAALLLAPRIVPESRLQGVRRRFDPLGAVTVTGALLLLVYAISKAPEAGWGSASHPPSPPPASPPSPAKATPPPPRSPAASTGRSGSAERSPCSPCRQQPPSSAARRPQPSPAVPSQRPAPAA